MKLTTKSYFIFIIALILTTILLILTAQKADSKEIELSDGAPRIVAYDCEDIAWVGIVWYDPPQGIGAMTYVSPGALYVNPGDVYGIEYRGWYFTTDGKLVHEWQAFYERPQTKNGYSLWGYVRSLAGGYYWFEDYFYPPCQIVYLPMIKK